MTIRPNQLGTPVDLRPWFAPQRRSLVAFLQSLAPDDWQAPTACDLWNVRDLVAHVLSDLLGRIAGLQGEFTPLAARPDESLEQLIDRANQEWVVGTQRLGPQLMLDMLDWAGDTHDELWNARGLDEPSIGVSWAGVEPAPLWFDAARDVTEYWIHERQLRQAVGDDGHGEPGLATVLDVFARGLPFALTSAQLNDVASVTVSTDLPDLRWDLQRTNDRWSIVSPHANAETTVSYESDLLWQRWTRQAGATAPDPHQNAAEMAVFNHVAIVHSAPDS